MPQVDFCNGCIINNPSDIIFGEIIEREYS